MPQLVEMPAPDMTTTFLAFHRRLLIRLRIASVCSAVQSACQWGARLRPTLGFVDSGGR